MLQPMACCEPRPRHTTQKKKKKLRLRAGAGAVGPCSPLAPEVGAGSTAATPAAALDGNHFGLGADGATPPAQGRTPWRRVGFLTAHLLFRARLGFLLQFRRLGLLLRLPHELLDEPPGDDRQEQGRGGRGWPPVLVPDLFEEQRLGYGPGSPRQSQPREHDSSTSGGAEHRGPALLGGGQPGSQASCRLLVRLGAAHEHQAAWGMLWRAGGEALRRKAPQRSTEVSAHGQGPGVTGSPRALPALPKAQQLQHGHGRNRPRPQGVQKRLQAWLRPHADLPRAGLQAQTQPRFPQLPQQRASPAVPPQQRQHRAPQLPRASAPQGTACPGQNCSNQNAQAAEVPELAAAAGAGRWGDAEPRGVWQPGCCASPRPAPSPRAAREHPAPKHHWCHPGPRLSFCSQSARREEMAMAAPRQDGAVQGAVGPVHEVEREERVSRGLLLAPGLCRGRQHLGLARHCPGLSSRHWLERGTEGMGGLAVLGGHGHVWPPPAPGAARRGARRHGEVVVCWGGVLGWRWDPTALGWVARGGRGSPPVPRLRPTPASPVEIIHAPSGSGLVWPCRSRRQPHRLVQ